MHEQLFPRPLSFLDENDPLIEHFWSLVRTNDEISCLWILATNQVGAAYAAFAPLLPLGSPDPLRQQGVEYLHHRLAALCIAPMDHLMERLRVHAPDLTRLCGRFLCSNLESLMLRLLRRRLGMPPEPPFRWRGEYLTADNPIRVGPHRAGYTVVEIPDDVSGDHVLKLQAYLNAHRPPKRPGRPRKPPGAAHTPQPRAPDPLAQQAAALKQQGLHWRDIARRLWPDEPPPTEHKACECQRQRVNRLVFKGRRDALG
jgi:hypothetical protein